MTFGGDFTISFYLRIDSFNLGAFVYYLSEENLPTSVHAAFCKFHIITANAFLIGYEFTPGS